MHFITLSITILLAISWCSLHSLLITHGFQGWSRRTLGRHHKWHRLVYNIFSILSLLPVLIYFHRHPGPGLWTWVGFWQGLRIAGLMIALWLLLAGVRAHDNRTFLGLSQLRRNNIRDSLDNSLSRRGILNHLRHPYYAGAILLLVFYNGFSLNTLVWRGIFIAYLLLGTWLEERKLLKELGKDYRDYRSEVPAYFPHPFPGIALRHKNRPKQN